MPNNKVITRKAIDSLAKRTGATVSQSEKVPKPIKKPAAERQIQPGQQPQLPAPVIDQGPVIDAIEGASEQVRGVIEDLMRQISEIKLQVDRPTEWIFDFERDSFGRTKRIRASVPDFKKLLN